MSMELDAMDRIVSEQQLEEIFGRERVVLFKHSTRCPISAHAFSEMKSFHRDNPEVPVFVLHVVEDRGLSEYVTRRTGVHHESPQLLLLEQGSVCWHASHFDVTSQMLRERIPV